MQPSPTNGTSDAGIRRRRNEVLVETIDLDRACADAGDGFLLTAATALDRLADA